MKVRSTLFAICVIFIQLSIQHVCFSQEAENHREITFQGVLTHSESVSEESTITLVFHLYNSQHSTEPLWKELHEVRTHKGVFQVSLGSKIPLPQDIPGELWLGISDGNAEFTRMKMNAVPYALHSHTAIVTDSIKGGNVQSINGIQGNISIVGTDGLEVSQNADGNLAIGFSESGKQEKTLNQGTEWG